ncbi:MAG: thioredoxin-dependent thiol peroxidase [candidate division NC10 bacterium]|nr:thioredoxin-dependent thiol peroxidase [candidate division NC10 bacterium]
MVEVGQQAPAFTAVDATGRQVKLSDFKGRHVVLYFYPKDMTPGCTTEACDFRDAYAEFGKLNAMILGISPDGPPSHQKFIAKYQLPFPLLSDPDHTIAGKYGVWQEKKLYGKTFMGIVRTTFLIDSTGKVRKVFPKVKVSGHTEEVLAALKALAER